MQLQAPFHVVTPTVDGSALQVLANADAAFTPPQVHRLAGAHSLEGIRKALQRLATQGIVEVERVGHADRYSLNRDHLAAPAIIALARIRQTLIDRMRQQIQGWPLRATAVALFGSAARGQMEPDSDIDLLVVRPEAGADDGAWDAQVDELARLVTRWTGNDTQVIAFDETDLHRAAINGDPLLDELARDAIWLVGSARVLRRSP